MMSSAQMAAKAKKTETQQLPATIDPSLTGSWSKSYGVDAQDVLIPRLLIMQPISDAVTRGDRKPGDLVRSTTNEVLGGPKAPVWFIPLFVQKIWILLEKVSGKYEFRSIEPFTWENAQLPWEFEAPSRGGKGSAQWRRDQANNVYALLPADIAKFEQARARQEKSGELPDPQLALLPIVIQFSRTSFATGKQVMTHFAQAESLGQAPAATTLSLVTEFTEGDKGNYFVFKLGVGRQPTPMADLKQAKDWFARVTKAQHKVDERFEDLAAKPQIEGAF